MFNIIDRHTGAIVATVKTLQAALRSVDRRDNSHGSYRFTYRRAEATCNRSSIAELAEWRSYVVK